MFTPNRITDVSAVVVRSLGGNPAILLSKLWWTLGAVDDAFRVRWCDALETAGSTFRGGMETQKRVLVFGKRWQHGATVLFNTEYLKGVTKNSAFFSVLLCLTVLICFVSGRSVRKQSVQAISTCTAQSNHSS